MEGIKILRPLKAIRQKCLDCCNNQQKEVRECPIVTCTLHPYRMGHRPPKVGEAEEDIEECEED